MILDEALVFRAPKAKAYRDALADEARLLRYLQPRVEVGIPDYVYQSADGSFAGYPILVGRELDAATFGRLSADERGPRTVQAFKLIPSAAGSADGPDGTNWTQPSSVTASHPKNAAFSANSAVPNAL